MSWRLAPFKSAIDAMLFDDTAAPRKQRHTARRLLARLIEEHGSVDLSYSTVRDYVRVRRETSLRFHATSPSTMRTIFWQRFLVHSESLNQEDSQSSGSRRVLHRHFSNSGARIQAAEPCLGRTYDRGIQRPEASDGHGEGPAAGLEMSL